jgi:hypothetical protein
MGLNRMMGQPGNGILDGKQGRIIFLKGGKIPFIPTFHYSSIPLFQF